MKKLTISTMAITSILGSLSSISAADEGLNILNDIKLSGQIRPRYEHADTKDNAKDAANAFTARTRLAIEAGLFDVKNLTTKIGVTSVNNFGYTNYAPADAKYDTILDPQQAMLSEAYLNYNIGDTSVLAGRSHVNLDDQRFIGTVGWRQMERAYDTVTVTNKSVENLTILGSYVYGWQGVNSNPTTETSSLLINANYKAHEMANISGFTYLLADVHNTYGLRVTGKVPVSEEIKLNYAASFAMQAKASLDYSSNANADIDANYIDLAVSTKISGILLGVEYEKLGKANGSSTKGFTTPLATLHKFQGFADEFLGQTDGNNLGDNSNGLSDLSLKAGYSKKGLGKAVAMYHKFSAETGNNTDLGSEIDALYANKIPGIKGLNGLVKVAYYMSGDQGVGHDNNNAKLWLQVDYKF